MATTMMATDRAMRTPKSYRWVSQRLSSGRNSDAICQMSRRRLHDAGFTILASRRRLHDPDAGRAVVATTGDTCPMGFNPHRVRRRTPSDYLMVFGALAVVVALVVWALVG